jgi:hypothetical protein
MIKLSLVLILMTVALQTKSFAATCTTTEKNDLIALAQGLYKGSMTYGPLYQNVEKQRTRRVVTFPNTTSFLEVWMDNTVVSYIWWFVKPNGKYTSIILTNYDQSAVEYCDSIDFDTEIQWINGLPKIITPNLLCASDSKISAPGHIHYTATNVEMFGGTWEKNGTPTTCDGETSAGTYYFTLVP